MAEGRNHRHQTRIYDIRSECCRNVESTNVHSPYEEGSSALHPIHGAVPGRLGFVVHRVRMDQDRLLLRVVPFLCAVPRRRSAGGRHHRGPSVGYGPAFHSLLRYAEDHHVTIYYLPPHTTHYLQPVDYSLFRPLKRAYQAAEDASVWTGTPTDIYRIPVLFGLAWKSACNEENIKAGFRGTGLYPFDPQHVIGQLPQVDQDDSVNEEQAHLDGELGRGGEGGGEEESEEEDEVMDDRPLHWHYAMQALFAETVSAAMQMQGSHAA